MPPNYRMMIGAAVLVAVAATLVWGFVGAGMQWFGKRETLNAQQAATERAYPRGGRRTLNQMNELPPAMLGQTAPPTPIIPQGVVEGPATMSAPPPDPMMLNAAAVRLERPRLPLTVTDQPFQPETAAQVPPNYLPAKIELYEAHWQGLDARKLDAELRKKLKFTPGLKGLLVGEVSLAAGDSGMLAGDVIVEVNGNPVATLEEFQRQTRLVRDEQTAKVKVHRKIDEMRDGRYVMRRLVLVIRGEPDLGMAQVEGAPMITAGDPRPHSYRGPCTDCHTIGTGFELTPDPDLITLPPPPITQAVATSGQMPHRNRGPCVACHVVTN